MSGSERRLAAIMFTDMVGYSALTHEDEALSLSLLQQHRHLLRPLFPNYGGREIKTTGDGFLVEYVSALQAVECAVAMQQALADQNETTPDHEQIRIRIGIHLGDVVGREGDVYGDGVNIAARIEPLAEPGGICISQQVYDHVRGKVEEPLVRLGTGELKNIQIPVEIYRVALP